MLRFLFVLIVLALIASVILKLLGFLLRKQFMRGFTPPPPPLDEPLVRCTICQVFVPRSKALTRNDRYYCSDHCIKN